jgi:hypothetical protein
VRVVRPTSGPVEAYEVWHTREFDQTCIFICGLRLPANLYAPFEGSFSVFWEIPPEVHPAGFAFCEGGPGGPCFNAFDVVFSSLPRLIPMWTCGALPGVRSSAALIPPGSS